MNLLAIDIGSSSVKLGFLRNGKVVGRMMREDFPTRYEADRAEVKSEDVVDAIARAIAKLPKSSTKPDAIALASMAPSWVTMDARGKAITPIVTHQDRRSRAIAVQIEKHIGKQRHLALCGCRPIPGGISSTTFAWFRENHPSLVSRFDLVGHIPTLLHRQLCGTRVIDTSHASFTGFFSTFTLKGWNDELCDVVRISKKILPEIFDANEIAGKLTPEGASRIGLPAGTPMLAGMIDTGGAMLLAGAKVGQIVNVVGSTDVLALCTDKPQPHENLLTRALGVGRRWLSVGTLAAAGSSLNWAHQQLFSDLNDQKFFALVSNLAKESASAASVTFDPYLAGDRCAVEQRSAAFGGLTLSSTRENMLASIVHTLARDSAARLALLESTGTKLNPNVIISGGGDGKLAKIMHRDWKGKWRFKIEEEATVRGMGTLVPRE